MAKLKITIIATRLLENEPSDYGREVMTPEEMLATEIEVSEDDLMMSIGDADEVEVFGKILPD